MCGREGGGGVERPVNALTTIVSTTPSAFNGGHLSVWAGEAEGEINTVCVCVCG